MINTPVNFVIEEAIDFTIKEMVCTLKNIVGDYSFCKSKLAKIYGAILDDVSDGNIKVQSSVNPYKYANNEFEVKITFSKGWEEYDVSKDWEGENPLGNIRHQKEQLPIKSNRRISGKIRQNVLMRDKYTCQICGATVRDGAKLEIDHIIPKSKGGGNDENNLQVLCQRCNREKHNRTDLLHDKLKMKELGAIK